MTDSCCLCLREFQYLHTDSVTPAGHTPGPHSRSARPSPYGRKDLLTEAETPERAPDQRELLSASLGCRSSAWAGLYGCKTQTQGGKEPVEHSIVLFVMWLT